MSEESTEEYRERTPNAQAESAMPRYRRNRYLRVRAKDVFALKIAGVATNGKGTELTFEVGEPIHVDRRFAEKHAPEAGSYYVVPVAGDKRCMSAKVLGADYSKVDA